MLSHLAERRADRRKMLGQMSEVEELRNLIDGRKHARAFLYRAAPVMGCGARPPGGLLAGIAPEIGLAVTSSPTFARIVALVPLCRGGVRAGFQVRHQNTGKLTAS